MVALGTGRGCHRGTHRRHLHRADTVMIPSSRFRFCFAARSAAAPAGAAILRSASSSFSLVSSLRLKSSLRMELFSTKGSIYKEKGLVGQLKHYGIIKSDRVAEVMQTIDRGLFVPEGTPAYVDSPMPIGYNATISAPHMHATCLELLEQYLQPGMHALDVGSGSGYLTACFAMMVGPEGRAVGVEHIPELAAASIENMKRSAASSLINQSSLSVHATDGRLGWPELAPYDAIHVGAASPDVPRTLLDQLKPGGRMVIPVGNFFQDLKVVDKNEDGSVRVHSETAVRYVPLTSREVQLQDNKPSV